MRVYLWRSLLIVVLASTWIASGVLGLLLPESVIAMTTASPWNASRALPVVALARLAGIFDLALGISCLLRRKSRRVFATMLAALAGYTIGIGALWPQHWLDPFGGLVKNAALFVALGLLIATEERR